MSRNYFLRLVTTLDHLTLSSNRIQLVLSAFLGEWLGQTAYPWSTLSRGIQCHPPTEIVVNGSAFLACHRIFIASSQILRSSFSSPANCQRGNGVVFSIHPSLSLPSPAFILAIVSYFRNYRVGRKKWHTKRRSNSIYR